MALSLHSPGPGSSTTPLSDALERVVRLQVCVRSWVGVLVKLHITEQSGPVIVMILGVCFEILVVLVVHGYLLHFQRFGCRPVANLWSI